MLIRDDALHNNSITSPHIAETYLSRIHAFTGEMTFFTTLVAWTRWPCTSFVPTYLCACLFRWSPIVNIEQKRLLHRNRKQIQNYYRHLENQGFRCLMLENKQIFHASNIPTAVRCYCKENNLVKKKNRKFQTMLYEIVCKKIITYRWRKSSSVRNYVHWQE
jgi:hypothetical protein